MGPVEALQLALRKEQEAIELYQGLRTKFPEIKDTLDFLITEEFKHHKLLEETIRKLKG